MLEIRHIQKDQLVEHILCKNACIFVQGICMKPRLARLNRARENYKGSSDDHSHSGFKVFSQASRL